MTNVADAPPEPHAFGRMAKLWDFGSLAAWSPARDLRCLDENWSHVGVCLQGTAVLYLLETQETHALEAGDSFTAPGMISIDGGHGVIVTREGRHGGFSLTLASE